MFCFCYVRMRLLYLQIPLVQTKHWLYVGLFVFSAHVVAAIVSSSC